MKRKSYGKMLLSVCLVCAMIFTSTDWSQAAEWLREISAGQEVKKSQEKQVVLSESTKNSTTFQLADGKKQTVFYGQDVRFENEDGKLTDYDPSLVKIKEKKSDNGNDLSGYLYENKAGDKKQYLPKDLTEKTPVLMENGDYEISFAPIYGTKEESSSDEEGEEIDQTVQKALKSVDLVEENSEERLDSDNAFASIEKLKRSSVQKETVLTAEDQKEELPVKVSYTSEDQNCTFLYQSLDTGVKESITLTKAPESNQMQFKFYAKGLTAKKNVLDGGITFLDQKTEEIVASLEAPSMNDAGGKAYSEELSYDLEEAGEDTYIITLSFEEDYFKDKDRKYPVTIDPTVTWKGSTDFWDVYVLNGSYKNTNFYDSGVTTIMAGKAKQGLYRTYLRFKDFTAKIKNKYVDSATLTLYETGNSQKGQTIAARKVDANWSRPGLTWSNRPGYSTSYGTTTTTGTTHKARTINLTQYARQCASGKITSYGIMLRNADEEKSYGQFYSSRYSNATYRPKMSVTYYDGPTTAATAVVTPAYVGKNTHAIKLSWTGISSKSLDRVEYRLATWVNGTEGNSNYVPYSSNTKIGTTASGSATISSDSWAEGNYKIVVRGVDRGYIAGYGKGAWFTIDRTSPKINSVSMDQGNGTGTSEDHPSSNASPTLKWNITESNFSKIEYQVGNGSWFTAGNAANGSAALASSNFKDGGTYTVKVRAVDKAGNTSQTTVTYYYVDNAKANDYQPTGVSVNKSYGKAVVSWKKSQTALPGSIYYEVHRGTKEDFTPGEGTLIQSAIKECYCADPRAGDGVTYYYKVRAVKLAKSGKRLESTTAVPAGKIRQDAKSEYQQYLGAKDYRATVQISTPNGSGTIDKASGNLMYTGDDFDISVGAMSLTLTRTYNSQSDKKGMLGNGWYDTFHKQLYQVGNDIVFQDSDGTYVTFEKDGDIYSSKETKDYTLKLTNAVNGGFEEVSPNEESDSVLARTGENEAEYKPSHNITVTGEGGEKETEKETSQKTIAVACTLTDKDQNLYKFDSNGFLTAQEDANGNYLLYEYNDQGQLKTVTTSKNQSLTMEYGDHDLLQGITLPDSTKVSYTYDEDGNLTKVSKSSKDGNDVISTPYTYDENGWLIGIKDAKGNSYAIEYQANKAIAFTKPNGEYQSIVYGDGTTSVSVHKSDQTKVSEDSMTYDKKNGKQLSTTTAGGIETTYQYENSQNPLLQTGTQTKVCYQTLDNDKVMFTSDAKVTTTTTYDANENITKEVDETGQTTTTTYGSGKEVNFPKNEVTKNSEGEKISDTDYAYDEDGNTTLEYEDVGDTLTEYDYDEDGEIIEEISYEDAKSTDNKGVEISRETTDRKEADHQVEETLNNTQGEIQAENKTIYDAMGREMKSVDENTGEVTETTYDFAGRNIKTTRTLEGVVNTETKAYDANGTVTSETTSEGVTTTYQYDSLNRVKEAKETADGITKTTQTAYGYEDAKIHTLTGTKDMKQLSIQTTTTNGAVTAKTWTDTEGRTVRTYENGIYTDHAFTEDGKEIASMTLGTAVTGDAKVTLNLYDKEGRQTHTIQNPKISGETVSVDDNSIVTKTTYDANGNEAATINGNGVTTSYSYDAQNRLTKVSQGEISSTVSYTIGSDGKTTTSTTDANGHIKEEITNEAGLTESHRDLGDEGESIATSYTYDTNGNKKSETYQNGSYKEYSYDKKNRLIQTQTYQAGEAGEARTCTLRSKYAYDSKDRLVERIDARVTGNTETAYRYTEYIYDSRGNITSYAEISQTSQPTKDDITNHSIIYRYDADGRLSKVTYPTERDGITGLSYVYDANGWLQTVKAERTSGTNKTEKTLRSYAYDSYGKIRQIKDCQNPLGNGDKTIQRTYTYDSFDRVKTMVYTDLSDSEKVLESYAYEYDKNSNIVKKTEKNDAPSKQEEKIHQTKEYTYDSQGRLTKTVTTDHRKKDQKETITYTYDAAGNRLSEDNGSQKTVYTYNGLDQIQRATTAKGLAVDEVKDYTYDANGNQTAVKSTKTGEIFNYGYDAENRLEEVSVTKDGTTAQIQRNTYNGEGQRIQKIEGDQTINYYYQDGTVSYTTDGNGSQTGQNLIGLEGNVIGTQRYEEKGAVYYTYHKDIQGSTTTLMKEDGSVNASYEYTDFGETTVHGDNKAGNEVCYTGGIYDSTTGLYYLNARYYNPEDGRFLTEDTYRGETKEPDTWHLYAYCKNNPVNYTDLSGHKGKKVIYYAKRGHGFNKQAKKSPFYKNNQVDFISVIMESTFKKIWKRLPSSMSELYLYLHGGVSSLYFSGSDLKSKELVALKKKKITKKIVLLTCKGGIGGDNSVAKILARKCKCIVYASNYPYGLSYRYDKKRKVYYPRYGGVQNYFNKENPLKKYRP